MIEVLEKCRRPSCSSMFRVASCPAGGQSAWRSTPVRLERRRCPVHTWS